MKRFVALITSIAAACTSAAAQESDLTADMLRRIRAAMPGAQLSVKQDDPLALVRKKSAGFEEAQINLHRIQNFCQQASVADCEAVKGEFVAKISKEPPSPTSQSLRLIVRDRSYLDHLKSMSPKGPDALGIYEPIGDDLFAVLAADGPDTVALVGTESLGKLKLTREQAWVLAAKQTRADLPALPRPEQLRKSAVAYEDAEYLASLLIDREAWAKIAVEVGPDLFATAVSDRFVLVGTLPDGADLERFRETVAQDCAQQERCVSPHIYRFRDGRWVIAQ